MESYIAYTMQVLMVRWHGHGKWRQNKMENKMSNVDSLALILQDRMRELDLEFRSTTSKVQSQWRGDEKGFRQLSLRLDLLLAAHETQQAEDLKHNKTWNLSNQAAFYESI